MTKNTLKKLVVAGLVCTGLVACGKTKEKKVYIEKPKEQTVTQPRPEPTPTPTAAPVRATVQIQNKPGLLAAKAGEPLTIQFVVQGINPAEVNVLCRAGRSEEFFSVAAQACNGQGSHKIDKIEGNASYAFSVELVDLRSNIKLAEDSTNIRAGAGATTIVIDGAEQLGTKTSGAVPVVLKLNPPQAVQFVCTVAGPSGQQPSQIPCDDGKLTIQLDQFTGRTQISIKAVNPQTGAALAETQLPVCGGSACGQAQGAAIDYVMNELGLGALYTITLPPNFHVLNYSTNRGFMASMTDRLSVQNDPLYPLSECFKGRTVILNNGQGRPYEYCQKSYAIDQVYKVDTGFRAAFDSIEFSTDAPSPKIPSYHKDAAYERFSFNQFDDKPEVIVGKSRFAELCNVNYGGGNPVLKIVKNYYGDVLPTEVNYCKTLINGQFGRVTEVWVAGFFFQRLSLNNIPNALEMTYIVTAGTLDTAFRDEVFIRYAVKRTKEVLDSTGLNEPFLGYLTPTPPARPHP